MNGRVIFNIGLFVMNLTFIMNAKNNTSFTIFGIGLFASLIAAGLNYDTSK